MTKLKEGNQISIVPIQSTRTRPPTATSYIATRRLHPSQDFKNRTILLPVEPTKSHPLYGPIPQLPEEKWEQFACVSVSQT